MKYTFLALARLANEHTLASPKEGLLAWHKESEEGKDGFSLSNWPGTKAWSDKATHIES